MKAFVIKHINLFLTGVILLALAGLIVLGIFYMNEESEQDDLADEIAMKKGELHSAQTNGVDEDSLMSQALTRLETASEGFPENLDTTDVIGIILDYEAETNVEILPLNMSPAVVQQIDGQTYMAVSFTATVHGAKQNVMDFIEKLESGPIKTFTVTGVNLSGSGSSWSTSMSVTVISLMTSGDSDSVSPNSD